MRCIKKILVIFTLLIFNHFIFAADAPPPINLQDLGQFQKSVEKITNSLELSQYQQMILERAKDPTHSNLNRFAYCLLLALNDPSQDSRKMAITGLDSILQNASSNLTSDERQTITEIKNMVLFKIQEIEMLKHPNK